LVWLIWEGLGFPVRLNFFNYHEKFIIRGNIRIIRFPDIDLILILFLQITYLLAISLILLEVKWTGKEIFIYFLRNWGFNPKLVFHIGFNQKRVLKRLNF